jgi:hypothetical protein
MNALQRYAAAYIAQGWGTVKLRYRDKKPFEKEWQTRPYRDAAAFARHPGNLGVQLGQASGGLVDVDLDCQEAVELAPQHLPFTPARFGRASKPRSHWLYYATGPTPAKKFYSDKKVTIELRGDHSTGYGGQTAFPPSIHPSGEAYTWEPDTDAPTVIAYAELLSRVEQLHAAVCAARGWSPEQKKSADSRSATGTRPSTVRRALPPLSAAVKGGLDDDKEPLPRTSENIAKVQAMLSVIPGTISRDDWLNIGRALHWLGWDAVAFNLWDEWSSQFPETYDETGLQKQWRSFHNGGRSSLVKLGTLIHLAKQYGYTSDGKREEAMQYFTETSAVPLVQGSAPQAPVQPDILANVWWHGSGTNAQPLPWLIKNVLPETGVVLMPGQWGMGKTFVALDLANSVARGNSFANYMCKRPGGVLYLAPEGAAFIPIRLKALDEKFKFDTRKLPFAMLDYCPPLAPQQAPAFSLLDFCTALVPRMLEVHKVPLVLIIIDTLSAAHTFKDANDAAEAQKVMNYLNQVANATGACVVAIDHYGKDLDAGTRGSSAKEASADTVVAVLGERSQAGVVSKNRITLRKVRGGAQGAETHFTLPVMQLGLDEDGEQITACTVEWSKVTSPSEIPKTIGDGWPTTTAVKIFRAALQLMLDKEGRGRRPFPDHTVVHCVELAKVRQEFYARYPGADNPDAKRKAFKDALTKTLGCYVIQTREIEGVEYIWLIKRQTGVPSGGTGDSLVSVSGSSGTGPGKSGEISGISGFSGAAEIAPFLPRAV